MDIDVPREKSITERLAEWTVSMLDETASKSVHKKKIVTEYHQSFKGKSEG